MANALGELYRHMERYDEVERLLTQSLAITMRHRGPGHPAVAACINNLGLVYQETGRAAEAERAARRVLAIDEQAYGADHHEVALDPFNLALLLSAPAALPRRRRLSSAPWRSRRHGWARSISMWGTHSAISSCCCNAPGAPRREKPCVD